MTMHFSDLATRSAPGGAISAEEILALRRAGWSDGVISSDEAEALFELNDRIADATNEWSDFFVEAIAEFLINGAEPKGFLSDANAAWLIERIDRNGRFDSMSELELVIRTLEKATNVPQVLKDYALVRIEEVVLTGKGPTRHGGLLERGNVTAAEARLLRRVLFSQAGDRPAAISRCEAELLFRIKDATLNAANAPEWKKLFVQGVGNYLMAHSSYEPLSSGRAADLEQFMADTTPSLARFAARIARTGVGSGVRAVFGRKGFAPDHTAQVSEVRAITDDERAWLDGQIDANHHIDDYDTALLDFLAEETGSAKLTR